MDGDNERDKVIMDENSSTNRTEKLVEEVIVWKDVTTGWQLRIKVERRYQTFRIEIRFWVERQSKW